MNSKKKINLGKSWKRYQVQVDALISYFSGLSSSQMSFHSSKSEWNLDQVLEHLLQVEYLTLNAIEERVDSGIKKKSAFKHQKRYYQLALALILPKKYRVPKAVVIAEKAKLTENPLEQWKNQNAQMASYLHLLPKSDQNILLFMHPIAGPFNLKQTLGFLFYHLKHHHRQINTIKNDIAFPQNNFI